MIWTLDRCESFRIAPGAFWDNLSAMALSLSSPSLYPKALSMLRGMVFLTAPRVCKNLSLELKGKGVVATILRPGAVRTNMNPGSKAARTQ